MIQYRALSDKGKRSPVTKSREELDAWSSDQVINGIATVVWQYALFEPHGNAKDLHYRQELVGRYEKPREWPRLNQ